MNEAFTSVSGGKCTLHICCCNSHETPSSVTGPCLVTLSRACCALMLWSTTTTIYCTHGMQLFATGESRHVVVKAHFARNRMPFVQAGGFRWERKALAARGSGRSAPAGLSTERCSGISWCTLGSTACPSPSCLPTRPPVRAQAQTLGFFAVLVRARTHPRGRQPDPRRRSIECVMPCFWWRTQHHLVGDPRVWVG